MPWHQALAGYATAPLQVSKPSLEQEINLTRQADGQAGRQGKFSTDHIVIILQQIVASYSVIIRT